MKRGRDEERERDEKRERCKEGAMKRWRDGERRDAKWER